MNLTNVSKLIVYTLLWCKLCEKSIDSHLLFDLWFICRMPSVGAEQCFVVANTYLYSQFGQCYHKFVVLVTATLIYISVDVHFIPGVTLIHGAS